MTPAELRRAVIGAPAAGFRLVLKKSDWPITCRDPAHWSISPGGRFFTHDDGTGSVNLDRRTKRRCFAIRTRLTHF